jgi:lipopolysaccharide transport system ATP-binding protein
MATAIKVENLSKIYRLGEIGTGTISRDIERFVKTRILKQEDPFLKIGETNDRATKGASDIVYSLKDINFEIEQGDAVGIIGRNGAGKSTLLKILSRVTSPTTGKINIKGRVASLLEVGTGFHPELTGCENIYLNGAILGMRKREIDRKLDEIIDFSGVERYIDTPVKRYSSGMYVRLAFAVAAHLESEILIVDEVLAVGDAEFQKKCLGKMGEVSKGEGRTVLFVSHNIGAIQQLCNKGVFLQNGVVLEYGLLNETLDSYLSTVSLNNSIKKLRGSDLNQLHKNPLSKSVEFITSEVISGDGVFHSEQQDIVLKVEFKRLNEIKMCRLGFGILALTGEYVGVGFTSNYLSGNYGENEKYQLIIKNPGFAKGIYTINISIGTGNAHENNIIDEVIVENCGSFEIAYKNNQKELIPFWNPNSGRIHLNGIIENL